MSPYVAAEWQMAKQPVTIPSTDLLPSNMTTLRWGVTQGWDAAQVCGSQRLPLHCVMMKAASSMAGVRSERERAQPSPGKAEPHDKGRYSPSPGTRKRSRESRHTDMILWPVQRTWRWLTAPVPGLERKVTLAAPRDA